jgi:hypothetical protein
MARTQTLLATVAFCTTIHAQDPPKDFYGEDYSPTVGYRSNAGQIIATDGDQVPGITHVSEGTAIKTYHWAIGRTSFVMAKRDTSNTAPEDTLYRVDMNMIGETAQTPTIQQYDQAPGHTNYYFPWTGTSAEGVKAFRMLVNEDVYPGIDLEFYSGSGGQKMAFVCWPGSDPGNIRLEFEGQDSLGIDVNGSIKLYLHGQRYLYLREAVAYQVDNNNNVIPLGWNASYTPYLGSAQVTLGFSTYDPTLPLVLLVGAPPAAGGGVPDPQNLTWCTYAGGNNPDELSEVSLDANGDIYVTGYADDSNFPVGTGFQEFNTGNQVLQGSEDIVTMKFNHANKQIRWATYHGGTNIGSSYAALNGGMDKGYDVSAYKGSDPNLEYVYITGSTICEDFPHGVFNLPNPFSGAYVSNNDSANVKTVIAAYREGNGRLCWSTTHGIQLNGYSERGTCIDVDNTGTLMVGGMLSAGQLNPIPAPYRVTPSGAFTKNNGGGFLVLFDSDYQIAWCTPFGSDGINDCVQDIRIATRSTAPYNKVAYLTGSSTDPSGSGSPFFALDVVPPMNTNGFYQPSPAGGKDAYLARIDIESTYDLEYSTYWGGAGQDRAYTIEIEPLAFGGQFIHLAGSTGSANLTDIELPNGGGGSWHVSSLNGVSDAFVFKFDDATEEIVRGTLYGGELDDAFLDATLGPGGRLYLAGETRSYTGLVNSPNIGLYAQSALGNSPTTQNRDALLVVLDTHGVPVWTTPFGGFATDRAWGVAASATELYMVGSTNSDQVTFPVKEFDITIPQDWYDGNHLNNAVGTHGGLEFSGHFRSNQGVGGLADPAFTEPDGYLTSFAITGTVGLEDSEWIAGSLDPTQLTASSWFLALNEPALHGAQVTLLNGLGQLVRSWNNVQGAQLIIDLQDCAHGIYTICLTQKNGTRRWAKLMRS